MDIDVVRVLVAGGGVAGLEAMLALQTLAGDRARVELLAPQRHFTYRPLAVAEPFAPGSVQQFPLAAIGADRGVQVHRDALARVRPDERAVETQDGRRLAYDALVLAMGARPVEALPGALTFRGPQDASRVHDLVAALRDGKLRRVAFVVPPATTWTLPLYELALQTAAAVSGTSAELTFVTPEPAPVAAFGPDAGEVVAALLQEQGVALHTGVRVEAFTDGQVAMGLEGSVRADRVIALPRLLGPAPRGVRCDPLGFVEVDEYTRVLGEDDVYAVGDVAAHGPKQGGLAAQQADVAASVIAARAGAPVTPQPFRPIMRGLLLTGGAPRYLSHAPAGSDIADEELWWLPAKIFGRHLAPYLATHVHLGQPLAAAAGNPIDMTPAL
jgi:sulfide:quinone oxidoreductase